MQANLPGRTQFAAAPMRSYSSGMVARLGFVVAIHVNLDICTRAIVLERGRAVFSGTAADAADFYQGMIGRDTVSTVSA